MITFQDIYYSSTAATFQQLAPNLKRKILALSLSIILYFYFIGDTGFLYAIYFTTGYPNHSTTYIHTAMRVQKIG